MRFGLPRVITSDQGRGFHNELNTELAIRLGIDHHLSTPYYPQVSGSIMRIMLQYEYLKGAPSYCGAHVLLVARERISAPKVTSPFFPYDCSKCDFQYYFLCLVH